jgi:hypothetical protein
MKTRFLICAVSAIVLVGCKTTTTAEQTTKTTKPMESVSSTTRLPETNKNAALPERVANRWKTIVARDFESAFDFLSPGYQQTRTRDDYAEVMRNRPIKWTNATFTDQACTSADVCTVNVTIEYEFDMPVAGVGIVKQFAPVAEKWLRIDGVWYYLPATGGSAGQ